MKGVTHPHALEALRWRTPKSDMYRRSYLNLYKGTSIDQIAGEMNVSNIIV